MGEGQGHTVDRRRKQAPFVRLLMGSAESSCIQTEIYCLVCVVTTNFH